jgi:hypothetical protein
MMGIFKRPVVVDNDTGEAREPAPLDAAVLASVSRPGVEGLGAEQVSARERERRERLAIEAAARRPGVAEAAALLGCRPDEVLEVRAERRGVVITVRGAKWLVAPEDRPDAAGQHGLLLLEGQGRWTEAHRRYRSTLAVEADAAAEARAADLATIEPGSRAGDVVQRGERQLLVLPSPFGGLRMELVKGGDAHAVLDTASGRQVDLENGKRMLVVAAGELSQEVWTFGSWTGGMLPPPLSENERFVRRFRGKPWWAWGMPETPALVALVESAGLDEPPPWLAELEADVALAGLFAQVDEITNDLIAGSLDAVLVNRARTQLPQLGRMIDGRLVKLRNAWVEANGGDGATLDVIAMWRKMHTAAFWLTRDGTFGEVQLYRRQAALLDRDALGWHDPAGVLAETRASLRDAGEPLPVLPDLPAQPTQLPEAAR